MGGIDIKTEPSDKISLSAKLEYAKVHGRNFHRIIFNQNKQYHEHYYVGFAREMPEVLPKLGLPFSNAYKLALQLYGEKK